ncbi:MAG: cytochrome C [Betaproteobacteria bacterium]|nr:cytochrome C [Betaproteobacteria bacterium]
MTAVVELVHGILRFVLAAGLAVGAPAMWAQGLESRGEALYANHCVACHTCKAHTRRDPIVRNLAELAQQVDRWQANQKLGWTPEDRAAVVDYLNRVFYRF